MKAPADTKTPDLVLLDPLTKAQRFRARQIEQGRRQFAFWLTEDENEKVKSLIKKMRGA